MWRSRIEVEPDETRFAADHGDARSSWDSDPSGKVRPRTIVILHGSLMASPIYRRGPQVSG